jgi:hypothetical protein
VGADEGGEVNGGKALGAKELNQVTRLLFARGEDAGGVGGAGIFTSYFNGNGGPTWTCLDGMSCIYVS